MSEANALDELSGQLLEKVGAEKEPGRKQGGDGERHDAGPGGFAHSRPGEGPVEFGGNAALLREKGDPHERQEVGGVEEGADQEDAEQRDLARIGRADDEVEFADQSKGGRQADDTE